MPYGLTSMRDPRNKVNDRQDRTGLMDPENRLTVARRAGGWGLGGKGGGTGKHRWAGAAQSRHGTGGLARGVWSVVL